MRNEVIELYLDDVIPNRFQPREKFDEEALRELSTSIKEHGVIQPIIVRQIGEKYEIIAGERRYKASALAGLTKIPAIIRNLDDKEASKVALLENLQRKDLTAIEEARTYQKILELDSMTQEELGKTMGKSQAAIANKLRLLSLTDEVQEALLNDQISERHARSLLNLHNGNEQIEMLNRVIRERMTVRELDAEIKKLNASKQMTLPLDDESLLQQPIVIEENKIEPVLTPINQTINNQQEEIETLDDLDKPVQNTIEQTIPVEQNFIEKTFPEEQNFIEKPQAMAEPAINDIFKVEDTNKNTFIPNLDILEEQQQLTEKTAVETVKLAVNTLETKVEDSVVDKEFIEGFKYQDAVNLVKNIIPEITNKGVNANIQEFDLDNRYQIVINIDKN